MIVRDYFWVILVPLSWGWALVSRAIGGARQRRAVRLGPTTLSVGNIHSGGAAKTPLELEILKRYREHKPVLVARGYRSNQETRGARVALDHPTGPKEFGDEAWMLAEQTGAPTFVGRRRAQWKGKLGDSRLAILDDGFQHRQVHRDVDVVLIPTRFGIEENFCLPYGPLRESIVGLRRASLVVLLDEEGGDPRWPALLAECVPGVPVFRARKAFDGFRGEFDSSQPCLAFSGLANNEGFFQLLENHCKVGETQPFPDHHEYSQRELAALADTASQQGLSLVTTEKDWYKVSPWFEENGHDLVSLKMTLKLEDAFWGFLDRQLEAN